MPVFYDSQKFDKIKTKRFMGIELEVATRGLIKDGLRGDSSAFDFVCDSIKSETSSVIKDCKVSYDDYYGHDDYGDSDYDPSSSTVTTPWIELVSDGSVYAGKLTEKRKSFEREIRTSPTNGDAFGYKLAELISVLAKFKIKANRSCGFHVHVDARDLSEWHLEKTMILWAKIEEIMFGLVASHRKNGSWCRPIGANRLDTRDKVKNVVKSKNGHERYSSLNLCALEAHGTLENRMHQGTVKFKDILNWALLNANIIDYAKRTPVNKIFETSGIDLIHEIAQREEGLDEWVSSKLKRKKKLLLKLKSNVKSTKTKPTKSTGSTKSIKK